MIFAISDIHAHKKQLKEWIEAIGVNELKSITTARNTD